MTTYSLNLTPSASPGSITHGAMTHTWENDQGHSFDGPLHATVGDTIKIHFAAQSKIWTTVEIILEITNDTTESSKEFNGAVWNGTAGKDQVSWSIDLKTPTGTTNNPCEFKVTVLWTGKGKSTVSTIYRDPDPEMIVESPPY